MVVGGGYGGIQAALKLKDHCQVTLIDARDAFHHNMGAQRSAVEPGEMTAYHMSGAHHPERPSPTLSLTDNLCPD